MAPKKSIRSKGKTLALSDFLQETPSKHETSSDHRHIANHHHPINLPCAPRAARAVPIPNEPPYIVNLSNLPYDGDEGLITNLFSKSHIYKMNIPKNSDGNKLRGYGQIQFADYESLKSAVLLPEPTLLGRRIKVEVTTERKEFSDGQKRQQEEGQRSWRNMKAKNGASWTQQKDY